ncbi:MAG: gliding motility-associated C-terminal domain-containing protein [Salibacteraceae bacterium]
MAEKHIIEKVFKEALEHHEMAVSPRIWANVASSISASTSVGASVGSASAILGKAAAVVGMAGLLTVASVSEVNYHRVENQNMIQNDAITKSESPSETSVAVSESNEGDQSEESVISVAAKESELKSTHENDDSQLTQSEKTPESTSASIEERTQEPEGQNHELGGVAEQREKKDPPSIDVSSQSAAQEESVDKERVEKFAKSAEESPKENDPQDEPALEKTKEETTKTMAYFTHEAKQVITPNGDQIHDYFEIDGYHVGSFYIRIMTRTGKVVFESSNIEFRWDGKDQFGNSLPAGTYYYEIQAVGNDSIPYSESNARGSITIFRD